MPVNPAYEGREYPPSPVYVVGREKVREFATAVGATSPLHYDVDAARAAGYRDVIATPTFAVTIAQQCEAQVYNDAEAGIDFSRVVHGEEKFVHHRPITAGDELVPTLYVDRVREAGGHGMVTTRVELALSDGTAVSTVTSTVVVRGGAE